MTETVNAAGVGFPRHGREGDPWNGARNGDKRAQPQTAERVTLGWSDCSHDAWRRGRVLDPFAGSGTTLEAATGLGRDCIGFDLDARNAELARQRVGLFLEVLDAGLALDERRQ